MSRTLMHNTNVFSYAVIYLLCTGSFFINYKVQSALCLPAQKGYSQLYKVSVFTNLIIIISGAILQPELLNNLSPSSKSLWGYSQIIIFGIIFGLAYVEFEAWLCKVKKVPPAIKLPKNIVIAVMIVGLLEEILFRNFVNVTAITIGGHVGVEMIIFGVLAFGLSHLFAGWTQFFSKFIFSCFMSAFYFLSGSILMPIISHMVFNYYVIKKYPQGVLQNDIN